MMISRLFLFLCFLCLNLFVHADTTWNKIYYDLTNDPIDVVIVTHPKDILTLDLCIDGIRENCNNIRRVIVVSSKKLTDKAEWFDESQFPFSKEDVAWAIARGDKETREEFFRDNHRSEGWYFQQLLKLYSPFIIPKISSNVLVLDSDTIFLNPVEFLNASNGGLFCLNHESDPKKHYFAHAKKLVPGYKRIYPDLYSVCHHMLFQKPILKHLFHTVEQYHRTEFWVAFCSCVNLKENRGASEYEIYYNFALTHTKQVALRELKWTNSAHLNQKDKFKREGYHFVSFHTYLRKKNRQIHHL